MSSILIAALIHNYNSFKQKGPFFRTALFNFTKIETFVPRLGRSTNQVIDS